MMNSFASQREGGLGDGRASWLVTFDVISPYPAKPPSRERGRRTTKEAGAYPPLLKVPPPARERNDRRKERKGFQKGRGEEAEEQEKKKMLMREKK